LIEQRKKLLLFNECYSGNLVGEKWLVDGDRNPSLFHQSASNRKHRCSILRIKDALGVWLKELHVIRQKFIDDFSTRFTSARSSPFELDSSFASPVITLEENLDLIKLVT